jgi:hypothetical protein
MGMDFTAQGGNAGGLADDGIDELHGRNTFTIKTRPQI